MSSQELRKKFLDFFEKRGHKVVPSSSLLPDDPSVLLTTAGMQQFKAYYTGDADPLTTIHGTLGKPLGLKNVASIQKSFRTSDIDEVGDESHLTFFEMLGNFSFGGYFKKEAIWYGYDFITKELGLSIDYVSVFGGDSLVPEDRESAEIWKLLGVKDVRKAGREDNFWGPTGNQGPCGPTTEIYVKGVEIWNIVFNEYFQKPAASGQKPVLEKLPVPGVDTGMGLERLAMVVQDKPTIFETDLFSFLFKEMDQLVGPPEDGNDINARRFQRIVADHSRGIAFLLATKVLPSNKDVGYVLRRLIRSAHTALGHIRGFTRIENVNLLPIIKAVIREYSSVYTELKENEKFIIEELDKEQKKFQETKDRGEKEALKIFKNWERLLGAKIELRGKIKHDAPMESGRDAFYLETTHGFPFEALSEFAYLWGFVNLNRVGYEEEKMKHQEISRAGVEKKFGGHGLIMDTGELKAGNEAELQKVTRLHTATHLLNQALHDVLGEEVEQRGSDITPERTRFDFKFSRKVTPEELKKIEEIVNQKIKEDLPINKEVMPLDKALAAGARAFFKLKYPPQVSVYSIGDSSTGSRRVYSKELCGGPHVSRTGEIGKFKIIKEESSSAGIRRIRAIIEP